MISAKIEIEVFLEPDATQPSGYRFVHLKVGTEPSIPVLQDKPVSRRFVGDMVNAAKTKLGIVDKVAASTLGVAPVTSETQVPAQTIANQEKRRT